MNTVKNSKVLRKNCVSNLSEFMATTSLLLIVPILCNWIRTGNRQIFSRSKCNYNLILRFTNKTKWKNQCLQLFESYLLRDMELSTFAAKRFSLYMDFLLVSSDFEMKVQVRSCTESHYVPSFCALQI